MDSERLGRQGRARLEQLFPAGAALRGDIELRLLSACSQSVAEAESQPVSRASFEGYHHFLADRFKPGVEADSEQVLSDFKAMWPTQEEIAWICAAIHAVANDASFGAINCAMKLIPRSRFSGAAARIISRSMQTLLIADALDQDEREMYQHPLQALIAHLATDPSDADLRAELIRTVSVEIAGPFGERLLGAIAYSLHKDMPGQSAALSHPEPATKGDVEAFHSRLGQWAGQDFLLDPKNPIPAEVVGDHAAQLAWAFRSSIDRDIVDRQRVEDLADSEIQAHLLPPIARLVPGCTDDIHALRALAGRYTMLGNFQRARDLAELALQVAGKAPERCRLAWGAYADIHFRAHSFTNALLGLACAARTESALPARDLCQESYLLMRIARTQELLSHAQRFLQRARQLHALFTPGDAEVLRLEVASLSLRQAVVDRKDLPGLTSLLDDCQRTLERALQLNDELLPPTFLCAQVAGFVERAGGLRPIATWQVLERALQVLGHDTASYVRAVSSAVPTPDDVVAIHNRMNNARYSVDAPSDAVAVTMAARRLLLPKHLSTQDAFLACELLADRGLTIEGAHAPLTPQRPEQCAQTVAQEGTAAVLVLALDNDGELAGAVTHEGVSQVLRPARQQRSFRERIQTWSGRYPYAYGEISPRQRVRDERTQLDRDVGDSEFYDSMRQFDVPLPQASRVIVVVEPELAQLPCNLLLKGKRPNLAGYDMAFGMVPSLTWLSAIRAKPRTCDARRHAWISEGNDEEAIAALEVVRAMTEAPLQRHGVALDTSQAIPQGIKGSQMAIIAAHGQLMPDKKYIHRIADEGRLQESPIELARALEDVELVILFVCSGGRMDRHPVHSTTVGLPKMLLDKGCRTVIASPWPLESLAPGTWLPAFLEHWDNGAAAMDACHQANLQVASCRDGEPQVSLAMTVYGDPLLARAGPI